MIQPQTPQRRGDPLLAEPGGADSAVAPAASGSFRSGHDVDDPGVPLGVQLFAADGVTWVVSMPTGLANDTMWPDMDWIEALGSVTGDAEAETLEEVALR